MLDLERSDGTIIHHQQEDFARLGYLILQLACASANITREQHQQVIVIALISCALMPS